MIRLLAAVLCLWAATASAALETWPALYNVDGVASDDVLNVRAGPSASADIIGSLAHDATNIEVVDVDEDRQWGLVNVGEASGWVSLRFLERIEGQDDVVFPPLTNCYGTEPFWRIEKADWFVVLTRPGEHNRAVFLGVETPALSSNRTDRYAIASRETTTFVARQSCTDGMSDRVYGYTIDVVLTDGNEPILLSGCCSIQP